MVKGFRAEAEDLLFWKVLLYDELSTELMREHCINEAAPYSGTIQEKIAFAKHHLGPVLKKYEVGLKSYFHFTFMIDINLSSGLEGQDCRAEPGPGNRDCQARG